MRRVGDVDVKQPAWRNLLLAAIARNTVRGLPKPDGLPVGGDLALQRKFGRHRLVYRLPDKTVTLGSVKDTALDEARAAWLRDNPLTVTLECGRQVVVTYDNDNLVLPRPWPIEYYRRQQRLQGAFAA
jgi:Txe/YoeB family toxin of Txe-Axe toxin-antitoxin module